MVSGNMKKTAAIILLLFPFVILPSVKSVSNNIKEEVIPFREVWGYLMRGEEKMLKGGEPFSDIGYFSLWIKADGSLSEKTPRPRIDLRNRFPRVHIVISELTGSALTKDILEKDSEKRTNLIDSIVSATEDFDGVQIDFEHVSAAQKDDFISFLSDLKKMLSKEKILSVALPAKRSSSPDDAYDYSLISNIADRIIIMAYDEHWSRSRPGPVASYEWCSKVAEYSASIIPKEKLIMGLPLYGREWSKRSSRSVRYKETRILASKKRTQVYNSRNPFLVYKIGKARKVVYFDNEFSLSEKLKLYRRKEIRNVSFWRIGQGPNEIWARLNSEGLIDTDALSRASKTASYFRRSVFSEKKRISDVSSALSGKSADRK